MKTSFICLLILALVATVLARRSTDSVAPNIVHKCMHDEVVAELKQSTPVFAPQNYNGGTSRTLKSVGPLRFYIDNTNLNNDGSRICTTVGDLYQVGSPSGGTTPACSDSVTTDCWGTCTAADILTTAKYNFLTQTVLPLATQYLSRALSLQQVSGNLILTASSSCGIQGGVPIPTIATTTGLASADIALFVTARPTQTNVIAFAAACQQDVNNRPVAAQINFGPAYITTTAAGLRTLALVAMHELTHALGFSQSFFAQFVHYSSSQVTKARTLTGTNSATYSVNDICTPLVGNFTQGYFGCNTLPGAQLENGGGSGTAGSHWEKKVWGNEIMTGEIALDAVYSNLTLALLQDSGWYTADFSAGQILTWGQSKGCDFVNNPCTCADPNGACNWPGVGYSCSTVQANYQGCNFDRSAKSYCNLATYTSSLPAFFQYISGQPTKGGSSSLTDYCVYNLAYSNGQCDDVANTGNTASATGEVWTPGAKCFENSLVKNGLALNNPQLPTRPGCYTYTCTSTTSLVISVAGVGITCPSAGGSTSVAGYTGTIECPAASTVCANAFTPPSFLGITPTVGSAGGQTQVTVLGQRMNTVTEVSIGGAVCTGLVVDSTVQVRCFTGAGSAGSGKNVVLKGALGQMITTNSLFTYDAMLPYVTAITPASGASTGGYLLNITGSNFTAGRSYTVMLGSYACTNVVATRAYMTCTVGASATVTAVVSVVITDPVAVYTFTYSNAFTYQYSGGGGGGGGAPTTSVVSTQIIIVICLIGAVLSLLVG